MPTLSSSSPPWPGVLGELPAPGSLPCSFPLYSSPPCPTFCYQHILEDLLKVTETTWLPRGRNICRPQFAWPSYTFSCYYSQVWNLVSFVSMLQCLLVPSQPAWFFVLSPLPRPFPPAPSSAFLTPSKCDIILGLHPWVHAHFLGFFLQLLFCPHIHRSLPSRWPQFRPLFSSTFT